MTLKDFIVVKRYKATGEGWKIVEDRLSDLTIEEAWKVASDEAKHLDAAYGNDHFWTVDLMNPARESYVQLFHGRLS